MVKKNLSKKVDPREKYQKPPFSDNMQDPPGLERRMETSPDYGANSYEGNSKLEGRVALITGGDSGIGRATALAMSREGAKVAISYLSEMEDANEIKELIESEGRECFCIDGDIQKEKHCNDLVDETIKRYGRLDILVNNAAYQMSIGGIEEASSEEIDKVFRTNIFSIFYITKAALKHMKPGCSIINTTSIQAYDPSPKLMHYAATKAAIANITRSLAKELIKKGIRVNAVAPGPVWTPLIVSSFGREKIEKFGSNSLFARPAQPAELAPVYVFLASEEASYITGEIYGVTGGRLQI